MFVNTSCFCKRLKAMRPKKLQVFPLVHFSPQVLTFCLCMHMHIRSKHVWGFFPSVTKTFFARNLRYLNWYIATQSAITFSSEALDIFYTIHDFMVDFIAQTLLWARGNLARNWFQQKIIWYVFANTLQCSRIIFRYAEARGERLRISVVTTALPWLRQVTAQKDRGSWLRGAKLS